LRNTVARGPVSLLALRPLVSRFYESWKLSSAVCSPTTHAFVAAAMGRIYTPGIMPLKFWLLAMFCAVLPDCSAIFTRFGVSDYSLLGHRNFTHSLFFAVIASFVAVWLGFRDVKLFSRHSLSLWLFFFLCTASHGFLDSLTNGGLGIAFYSPFSDERYFMPWTPVEVPEITPQQFLGKWGKKVILSELIWICLPMLTLMLLVVTFRKWRSATRPVIS
jgi:inner membrane protein